eukprot:m.93577 g.93577  ORF g.93577 m.93577 type:complete len:551 (-) comp15378_c1_seq1:281-1933(-)
MASKGGCRCSAKAAMITFGVLGVVLLGLGFAANTAITKLMQHQIKEDVPLKSPSSTLYGVWQDTGQIPMFMVYYVFNVTNPEDVEKNGAKPNLVPVGPFSYTERVIKENVTWTEDHSRVRYVYDRYFLPVDTLCEGRQSNPPDFVCTLDDRMNVTTMNIPLVAVMKTVQELVPTLENHTIWEDLIDDFYKREKETVFMTRSAGSLIFGYEDPLLKLLTEAKLPGATPYFQLQLNSTIEAKTLVSEVWSGTTDVDKTAVFTQWQNYTLLDKWGGCPNTTPNYDVYNRQANMINGTQGDSFKPLLKREDVLQVYTEDLLRSSDLIYESDTSYKGIDLYRYVLAPYSMMNATEYAPNCGFDNYGPTGVLNMTRSVSGNAPIFASKPFFLQADPVYRTTLTGLQEPDITIHDTTLDIEPWTGSVMRAHQRVQINLHALPTYDKRLEQILPGGFYLPIVWADEMGFVSDDLASQWKSQVGLAIKASSIVTYAGVAIGSAFLVLAVVLGCILYYKRNMRRRLAREQQPLLGGGYSPPPRSGYTVINSSSSSTHSSA